ncbi:hypothetical protein MMC14_006300 [Varicellaria rhodocarpa]|nr:hypothetical protein [Varicellaria rhodocarpa]
MQIDDSCEKKRPGALQPFDDDDAPSMVRRPPAMKTAKYIISLLSHIFFQAFGHSVYRKYLALIDSITPLNALGLSHTMDNFGSDWIYPGSSLSYDAYFMQGGEADSPYGLTTHLSPWASIYCDELLEDSFRDSDYDNGNRGPTGGLNAAIDKAIEDAKAENSSNLSQYEDSRSNHAPFFGASTTVSAYQNVSEARLPSLWNDRFAMPNSPESAALSHESYGGSPDQSSKLEAACDCINCNHTNYYEARQGLRCHGLFTCPISECGDIYNGGSYFKSHFYEKHLRQEKGKYSCTAPNCKHAFKRPSDLIRHNKVVHCLRAEKFPCNVIGCKYGGDNGFTRKDKLKSHMKNAHEGKFPVNQPPRAIQPKVQKV